MSFLKKCAAVAALLALCLLFTSCALQLPFLTGKTAKGVGEVFPSAEADAAPTPAPTPSPTPSPVFILGNSYPWDTSALTLNLRPSDFSTVIPALSSLPNLSRLTIRDSSGFTADDYVAFASALPNVEIECTFDVFGQPLNTLTTERLEYLNTPIGDAGLSQFRKLLPYLRHLSYLSFDRCETSYEACAALRDDFPNTEVVWRVYFPPFSCMTDIETIWASVDLRDETCSALKYCTKVKNLDIGHSAMTDLSFLDYLPDLEVLIIACSDFEDISHVASCKNLKYFECCECFRLTDLSPICELKNLEHLNVGDLMVSDISCLHSLTECKNLKRFYAPNMRNDNLDMIKEAEIFRSLLPGVEMDFDKTYLGLGSLNGHWRYTEGFNGGTFTEPYRRIREIFRYDDGVLAQPRLY